MLTAENITFKISNKTLLDNVSVAFEPGKLSLIIGPNGAGKSTLIKVLCNQLKPETGIVSFGNKHINDYSAQQLGQIRAVLSQNIELSFPLKVWEVVMMGRYPHFSVKPTAKDEQACEEAMRFFDVVNLSDRNYMTLSGGEKQRVHFARVLAQIWYPVENSQRYLIMDEPLTFLDVHYQFQFMHKIAELLQTNNLVVVGVVHDLNLAAKFADQIILINQGKILAKGNKREVLTAENIKTAYRLNPIIVDDAVKDVLFLFFE
jgi:iron complex transport system ATP-binding protein